MGAAGPWIVGVSRGERVIAALSWGPGAAAPGAGGPVFWRAGRRASLLSGRRWDSAYLPSRAVIHGVSVMPPGYAGVPGDPLDLLRPLSLGLVILGVLVILLGLILAVGPSLFGHLRDLRIPEPLRSLVLVGFRAGGLEIYTSPLAIIVLSALYIALSMRR